ncbi:MMPL family transporter [Halobacillus shinanisalinarum]|uniref:MMPL family transporter n=1 Tax=Halobacillus shinanisalinarum TaxID=2932258 RepID=A0ABY4H2R8_9BACI|nr:MMPL family transporter [Halobacillus shinanisalinarum]UOQ94476.1 MMPL family transporter [Halobacillus shinanisalinarum]
MKVILRFKWLIAIAMIILTTVLFIVSPNLTKQAEEAGTLQLPEDADSQKAAAILEEAGANDETISLVFALDEPANEDMKQTITSIAEQVKQLEGPITNVVMPYENKETTEQLVSKDEKTILVPITVDGTNEEINGLADQINSDLLPDDITAYVTGQAIINQDVNESSQEGLERTEIITVVLIFVLLLAVFRSIITPFIPLVAVGVTYLLSQSIVSFFIDWFGFPVSNYTQIFLVAVLFGIGTDYCILLLSRYKEELTQGHSTETAIVNTYKTAGRTLLISGIAVFIGFVAIGFAEFTIFKSAVGVAVGIAVLMIVLCTLVPFFMAVLKEKLFWPSKKSASHKDSKLWTLLGRFSVYRPIWSLVIVAIITVPFLLTYNGQLSFNTVDEIGDGYDSVKGLNAIEEGFGKGESLPLNIIIKNGNDLVTRDVIPFIEELSSEITKNENVDSIRTITRPTGEVLDDLYADSQLKQVADGLQQSREGIKETQSGLSDIQSGLENMSAQLPSGSNANTGGLGEAANALGQVNNQLTAINQNLEQTGNVAQASQQLARVQQQLGQIQQSLAGASSSTQGQAAQIGDLKSGLAELAEGVDAANEGLNKIESGLGDAEEIVSAMGESNSLRETGVFIPEGTLDNEDLKPAIDRYSFDNEQGIMLEVLLNNDPYSKEAIDTTEAIKETVEDQVKGTPLEDMTIAYSGISSTNEDLSEISQADFTRTMIIMLVGLFIVLTVLFRSMIMPIYMIGSLLLTYYTSVSIAEKIFVNLLNYDGITWAVPFFGFVMLVALGVDYSIFLLDRFNEEAKLDVKEAMMTSMAKMGTVVITAAIILAGTFGAMMPSGVLSLIQIATIVITGLLLYGLIILPLLIPAITVSFGNGVWWPFKQRKN